MKRQFRWLLLFTIIFSMCSLPLVAEAYRCAWRNGHRVCWHSEHRCHWVNAHWRNGAYVGGHKVCR